MRYEFMTNSGEVIEAEYPMSSVPDIGTIVMVPTPDGTIFATRIFSNPASVRVDDWKPYASSRLPRHLKGVPCTPNGKPIVSSRAQERNIMAEFGYDRE